MRAIKQASPNKAPQCVQTSSAPRQKYLLQHLSASNTSTILLIGESTFTQMASHIHCVLGGILLHYGTLISLDATAPHNMSNANAWLTAEPGFKAGRRLNIGATQLRTSSLNLTVWYVLIYAFSESTTHGEKQLSMNAISHRALNLAVKRSGVPDRLSFNRHARRSTARQLPVTYATDRHLCRQEYCLTPHMLRLLLRSFGGRGTLALVSPPGLHYHDQSSFDRMASGLVAAVWEVHAHKHFHLPSSRLASWPLSVEKN